MASEQLFLLIKSLNPEEKRQFKLFSSKYQRARGNNYVRLFDAIDKMAHYDEQELRVKFRKEKFVKQLHVTKNYLYNLILNSLTLTHIENSTDAPLDGILIQAEILFKKSLYDPCLKLVEKGKELSRKMERPLLFIEFNALEHRIAIKKYDVDYFRRMSVGGYYEVVNSLNQLRDFVELRRLLNSLIVLMEKPFEMLSDEDRVKLYEESNHPILKSERPEWITDCRILYFNYRRQFYDYTHDYSKALQVADEYAQFIMGPENAQKTELFSSIMFALSNLVSAQLKAGKYAEAAASLQQLQEVHARTSDQRIMKDERLYLLRLSTLMQSRAFDDAIRFAVDAEDFLQRFDEKISRLFRLEIISLLSTLYFYTGHFQKSLQWRNRIINTPEKEVHEEIYEYSLLADLLIHLELKNHQLLQYKLKSAKRYFQKKKQYHALESAVIKVITQSQYKEDQAIRKIFRDSEESFLKLKQQKINTSYFDQFDFTAWVKSKAEKCLICEIRPGGIRSSSKK
ncbi:MAG: hypothetical protein IT233_08320 [Bacteroidia bacterium]|nr:hypothetical protein [Bacteroidia bacterium]